jgi:hypothetical protein
MKIFLKYLILPFITACIVIACIAIFRYWILDAGTTRGDEYRASSIEYPTSRPEVHASKETIHSPHAAASHRDFVYPIDGARDPFQEVSTSVGTQQPLRTPVDQPIIMLTGIIWDEENPIAIITDSENNSYLVRTGEEISRAKVLAIRPRGVTIEKDGKTQELILWPAKL